MKLYYVYILASRARVLYIGITSNLEQRVAEHRSYMYPQSFTSQYNVTKLVYVEEYTRVVDAIAREKQMKGWRRSKKVALIEAGNPEWVDLAAPPTQVPRSTLGMTEEKS